MDTVTIERGFYQKLLRRGELISNRFDNADTVILPRELSNELFNDSRAYHYLRLSLLREGFNLNYIDGLGRTIIKRGSQVAQQAHDHKNSTHCSKPSLETIEEVQEENDHCVHHSERPLSTCSTDSDHVGFFTVWFDSEETATLQPLETAPQSPISFKSIENDDQKKAGDDNGETNLPEQAVSDGRGAIPSNPVEIVSQKEEDVKRSVLSKPIESVPQKEAGEVKDEIETLEKAEPNSPGEKAEKVRNEKGKEEPAWDIIERPLPEERGFISRIKHFLSQAQDTRRNADALSRDSLGKSSPSKASPGKTSPGKIGLGRTGSTKTSPSKSSLARTSSTKTMAKKEDWVCDRCKED